jgi:hypothetical protein
MIVALLLIANVGTAENRMTARLKIHHVEHEHMIPRPYLDIILREVKARMKFELGLRLRTVVVTKKPNTPHPYEYDSLYKHFYWWYGKIMNAKKPEKWSFVAMPALEKNGTRYMVGLGHDWCFRTTPETTLSIGTLQTQNQSGADRMLHSVLVMMHELGHNFTLYHNNDEVPSVMASGVLYYATPMMAYSKFERKRARDCIRKKEVKFKLY